VGECVFWYRPTWVVPDQRPLNGYECVRACVCVCVCVLHADIPVTTESFVSVIIGLRSFIVYHSVFITVTFCAYPLITLPPHIN